MSDAVRLVCRAADFAARRHAGQTRMDGKTPYINHLAEVAALLANTADGAEDHNLVGAAWLHDVVEDEHATSEEIETAFGPDIRDLVDDLTDDMRLPKDVRKQRQVEAIPGKSRRARLLKLADKVSNMREIAEKPPTDWSADERRAYAEWGRKVVDAGCRGLDAALERRFDEAAARVLG